MLSAPFSLSRFISLTFGPSFGLVFLKTYKGPSPNMVKMFAGHATNIFGGGDDKIVEIEIDI